MSGRKIFIDCGGFDGCSIRKFRSIHPQGTEFEIFTFEPNETLCQFYDDSTTLIPAAVWVEDSEKPFFQNPNHIHGALNLGEANSLLPKKKHAHLNKEDSCLGDTTSGVVRTVDLGSWIIDNFDQDDYIILKLSVEGAEYDILEKMKKDNSISYVNELFVKWHWDEIGLLQKDHETFIKRLPIVYGEWDAMGHVIVEPESHQEFYHPTNEVFRGKVKNLKNTLLQQIIELERALVELSTVVVYTAIAGDIDMIEQPQVMNDKVHYVCFSDKTIENPGVWEIVPMDRLFLQSRKAAKRYKILPHLIFPEADYSIYIDGTFLRMRIDPIDAILRWLDNKDIAFFSHPNRACIYQEAEICSRIKKDSPIVIHNQMQKYR